MREDHGGVRRNGYDKLSISKGVRMLVNFGWCDWSWESKQRGQTSNLPPRLNRRPPSLIAPWASTEELKAHAWQNPGNTNRFMIKVLVMSHDFPMEFGMCH